MILQKATTPVPIATRATSAPFVASPRIPSVQIAERAHPVDHLLLWQVRGTSELRCAGHVTTLHAGQAAWVPSGLRHMIRVEQDSITAPLIISALEYETSLSSLTVVSIDKRDELHLLALWGSQSSIIQPAADLGAHVLAIVERAAHASALPMPTSAAAAAVARALVLDPGDVRQISEWATEVCVSGRSLERAFLAETGRPFGQWRKECRMLAARRMLRSGASVQSVARTVGYENPSSFSRAFRDFHGMRPRDCMSAEQRAA